MDDHLTKEEVFPDSVAQGWTFAFFMYIFDLLFYLPPVCFYYIIINTPIISLYIYSVFQIIHSI